MKNRALKDETLLILLRESNRNAFDEIYRRYWKLIYNIIYGQLKNREVTEELVQDLFISLWLRREHLEVRSSFVAYLSMGARYLAFKKIRFDKVRQVYLAESYTEEPLEESTERTVFLQDLQRAYDQEMAHLPDRCRQVFSLSRNEHKTIKEIASELHISEKTVEHQISKAIKIMRFRLKEFISITLLLLIIGH